MSQSKCLFSQNFIIDGYLLDTTWRVLPHYVTCILTVCFYNSSIPIAFGFGHGETIELYDFLLKTVSEQLGSNFNHKVFETDQGSALKSIMIKHNIIHLKCLRHLIHSFKTEFNYELTVLVKCVTQYDFDNCCETFSKQLKKFCEENHKNVISINIALKKIGLAYENYKIVIKDDPKWDQLSMCRRSKYHMPSTTNSLEATHAKTPRNNTFFSSIYRIHNEINEKFLNINQRINHNYSYLKRMTQKKLKSLNPITVQQMMIHYKTVKDQCLCSYNKLASSNYKCDIPCFHSLLKGATFPDVPQIKLNLKHQYDNLKIVHDFVPAEKGISNEVTEEINYAVSTINPAHVKS